MAENSLDGMLIIQPENRRYLSGFTGSAGVLIVTAERQVIATDFRYYEQVQAQCPEWELIQVGYDFVDKMLDALCDLGLGGLSVGFEAGHVSVDQLLSWERALKAHVRLINTTQMIQDMRMSKDEGEIQAIRRAVALADEALAHIYDWAQPGMSERQVAWELESTMRTRDAAGVSFEKDDKYLKIWDVVLRAQERAEAGMKAGITGVDGDKLARDVIVEAGYGDYFGHGLGHGVGLAIHEYPRLSFRYSDEIPSGAVMTVEPGIYVPDWGGVRIEDMVLVDRDGVEVLTGAAKVPVLDR
jgi:Xaa-Pro aminopeptidase